MSGAPWSQWKVYRENTGDPVVDNRARALNRALRRSARAHLRISARGRARRRLIWRIEGGKYVHLVAAAAQLIAERGDSAAARLVAATPRRD